MGFADDGISTNTLMQMHLGELLLVQDTMIAMIAEPISKGNGVSAQTTPARQVKPRIWHKRRFLHCCSIGEGHIHIT